MGGVSVASIPHLLLCRTTKRGFTIMMQCTDLPTTATNAAVMLDSSIDMIGFPIVGLIIFGALLIGIWKVLF